MIQHNHSAVSFIRSHFFYLSLYAPLQKRYIHMQIGKKCIITYLSRKPIISCHNEYSFMKHYNCNNYTFNGRQLSVLLLRYCIIYHMQHFICQPVLTLTRNDLLHVIYIFIPFTVNKRLVKTSKYIFNGELTNKKSAQMYE